MSTPENPAGAGRLTNEAEPPLPDGRSLFIRLTDLTGRVAMRVLTHVDVEGLDQPLPASGPLIVASNHMSNADGVLVASWITPALDRRVYLLGKREALAWPLIGWGLAQNAVIGVRRGAGDLEAFRAARRVLDEGHVLAVFPEGTRSPTGGLQEAKDGVAILALRTGAPILPVGVAGTNRFWPRGKHPQPGRPVSMRVGRPFTLTSPEPGTDRRAAQRRATEQIMTRIAELLPPRHRGAYAHLVTEGP
ncbi:MAG TPA: lysophospholipid acyltransferase family protein [Candidatus Saccharimonadales bacterium]|nr:lysophospholipid acyltransferase family protein [Candidatus Saccharimonadales bacterium]